MFAKEYSKHSKFFFNVYMYQIPLQRKQHCKHNSNNSLDKNITILKYKTVSFLKNISCTEWAFSIHQDILDMSPTCCCRKVLYLIMKWVVTLHDALSLPCYAWKPLVQLFCEERHEG